MDDSDISGMTFEQAMAALEQVVNQLERGEVALDQSVRLSERGAKLKERCAMLLKEAEERVEKILLGEGGVPAGTVAVEGL
ncbi:exodeoxyribonuclease VII small subunit [Rhodobacter capsulatus]|jgi:exodeoxyribonuclease VII small subunit|uniref:Exodeoxyribonuclease 7 small subunit n=2 Tax=Rhodobacter capsulatus TaxID=1061 RepID=D5ASU3_RHOCB|nr:exodeoxyribonuclease VII small subunit [Rhodobacter capsulatus]ADE87184.1 exodeoxyribonuclease VII, small subunit [Rhodobacter capsulatus SB 1003]ETD03411.1 exodeoxyribonuclease VII small subunit [Rhodobacter capsulatus DE442]ETD78122.1 exodeoxyribonuclease VII small subunit [Rhodobacter capsulatus B6]ETD80206.1 exodeoxyribonuclease VII small subunit [Rhodobacter capsulatus R121]ETD82800.1 exodeoxyribonuclease VII small subunit [Rhodobacter capsulatus YW1]